jgi:hypothetical protein
MCFVIRAAGLLFITLAAAPAAWAECNPNGVEHEVIECIEEANEAEAKKLGAGWEAKYKQFLDECRAENPGGGSGGRADRAECVGKKIEEALK